MNKLIYLRNLKFIFLSNIIGCMQASQSILYIYIQSFHNWIRHNLFHTKYISDLGQVTLETKQ